MFAKLKAFNDKVWAWAKNSGTILYARFNVFIGLLLAGLAGMDWSPLVNLASGTGFNIRQLVTLGSVLLVNGVIFELIRRRKASSDPV